MARMLAASPCSVASLGGPCSIQKQSHSTFLGQPRLLARPSCHLLGRSRKERAFRIRADGSNGGAAEANGGGGFVQRLFGWWENLTNGDNSMSSSNEPAGGSKQEKEPSRTVLVVGATGRTGREVVKRLLEKGDRVVALVASKERGDQVFQAELGWQVGQGLARRLSYSEGDLAKPATLASALENADAVIYAAGARFGSGGYNQGSMPEDTDGKGVADLVRESLKRFGDKKSQREETVIFEFGNLEEKAAESAETNGGPVPQQVEGWLRLDDVIMGGISDSVFRPGKGCAVFEGTVRVEGGGFCGTRAEVPGDPKHLSDLDGITIAVRGDGQRYKMNLKSVMERPEFTYQTSFDTVRGEWVTVDIPFDRFRPVVRARVVEDAPPLEKDNIRSVGLVLSRFEYDGFPNPLFTPGNFNLEVASIKGYKAPRPQFVLLSSAAVERNARVRTPEERARQIPIVKLNPGGILTWKLAGEDFLRASGLSYTVVRACGLTTQEEDVPFNLEVAQGDVLTGPISRAEVAQCLVEALDSPDATNTTFEVRRDELSRGVPMSDWTSLFRRLRPDRRPGIANYSPPVAELPSLDEKKGSSEEKKESAKEPEKATAAA